MPATVEAYRDFNVPAGELFVNRKREAIVGFVFADLRDCPAAFRARVRDDSPFSRIALASAPLHEFRLEVRRQLRDIDPHCFPFLPQNGVRYRHDGERERRMD